MDQMDTDQFGYINRLISKGEKCEHPPIPKKKSNNGHERTKSYANIMRDNYSREYSNLYK